MNLIFIENRYKTYFFDAIAKELMKEHKIFWLVQNPQFTPKHGEIRILPFPKNIQINKDSLVHDENLEKIIQSDRQINFFNKKDSSYFYYYSELIKKEIEDLKPDFVFGESTAFHELLTINVCRNKGIPFLQPTSCRYPAGRFSFYKYDTVDPDRGSKEELSYDDAMGIINKISNRTSKPDYMTNKESQKIKKLKDKVKILRGYYKGEKYNTPNPLVKLKIEQQHKENIKLWNNLAVNDSIDENYFTILYPLHMQPEANIDVWGREKRDQLESIRQISAALKEDQILYVKPNPKSKYELSKDLIDFISSATNVKMLHHQVSMNDIFSKVDLFITVNGTIALECIFSNKPILTLVNVFFNKAKNCLYLKDTSELDSIIKSIKSNAFPILTNEEKVDYLNLLCKTSYKGVISDPFNDPKCISPKNIKIVEEAFVKILES